MLGRLREPGCWKKRENLCSSQTFHIFVVELKVIAWFHWNKLGPVYRTESPWSYGCQAIAGFILPQPLGPWSWTLRLETDMCETVGEGRVPEESPVLAFPRTSRMYVFAIILIIWNWDFQVSFDKQSLGCSVKLNISNIFLCCYPSLYVVWKAHTRDVFWFPLSMCRISLLSLLCLSNSSWLWAIKHSTKKI